MDNSKLYATCPRDGRRLCKAIPGSEVEQECPHCKSIVLITVDDQCKVSTQIIKQKSDETA